MTRRVLFSMTAMNVLSPRPVHAAGKGSVAFCYAAAFDRAALAWYSRFQTLVTGGILAKAETGKLLNQGCKPIAYEWSSAFYPGDAVSADPAWQRQVLARSSQWLIRPEPVGGGAASEGKQACWYDFAYPELCSQRALHVAQRIVENGYNGVFLDTLGFEQLPAEVRAAFAERHPGVDYNQAQGEFLRLLRHFLGRDRRIFVNQGYRHADLFLPHADLDLTESTFTADKGRVTLFRSWHDVRAPWESILTPMQKLVEPASRKFPHVRFVHLGYASSATGDAQRALSYNFAAAKLWNHDAYLMMPAWQAERSDIYFTELGQPVDTACMFDERQGVAWRQFEKGLVALNTGTSTISILDGRFRLADPPRGYLLHY